MVCWAKNCRKERDAPLQIFYTPDDWGYCVLSFLELYLESNFEAHPNTNSEFVFCLANAGCISVIKKRVFNNLCQRSRSRKSMI